MQHLRHWADIEPSHFRSKAMIIYVRALGARSTAMSFPFILKLPLTHAPDQSPTQQKMAQVTVNVIVCEDPRDGA